MKSIRFSLLLAALGLALVVALVGSGCKRNASEPARVPTTPTVRLYVLSTVAGALEPCGCQKDMLGGIDHAASFIDKEKKEAPEHLVVGAGPMFFMDPVIDDKHRAQDKWKAEAIATAFSDLGLRAWAPGANDWALGAKELDRLERLAGADLLAANLADGQVEPGAVRLYEAGGLRFGVAGVAVPRHPGGAPDGVRVTDPAVSLRKAAARLVAEGADVRIALLALERGNALRLLESVPEFHVAVIGKPYDRGEANEAPTAPVLVGDTLVVQAPNHLQAIALVDLFVRDKSFDFADGSGIANAEERERLERRIAELERRIEAWQKKGDVDPKDLEARRRDLETFRAKLARMRDPEPPKDGSFFRYRLVEVRERLGSEDKVARRMKEYYRRVNEHNRRAFKDRKPPPVPEGQSGYLGAEDCSNCHDEEYEFWKTTGHAKAYETLAKQHKEFNLDCVSCHVTGYEKPGGSTVVRVEGLKDVQCEVCHGPGSRHEDDPENSQWITVEPSRDLCQRCHHPPHVGEDWNVDAEWPKILGPGHGRPAPGEKQ